MLTQLATESPQPFLKCLAQEHFPTEGSLAVNMKFCQGLWETLASWTDISFCLYHWPRSVWTELWGPESSPEVRGC